MHVLTYVRLPHQRSMRAAGRAILLISIGVAALLCAPLCARAAVNVCFAPTDTAVSLGDAFTVRVTTDGPPSDLQGYSIRLTYGPSVVQLLSQTEGSVLAGHPYSFFAISEPPDTCGFDAAVLGETTSGPGTLGLIQFKGVALGTSTQHFTLALLRDSNNMPIDVVACDAQIVVVTATAAEPATWGRIKALYRR
jgi:hypothetical protein